MRLLLNKGDGLEGVERGRAESAEMHGGRRKGSKYG